MGLRRKSTISVSSDLASSMPATSANVTVIVAGSTRRAFDRPKLPQRPQAAAALGGSPHEQNDDPDDQQRRAEPQQHRLEQGRGLHRRLRVDLYVVGLEQRRQLIVVPERWDLCREQRRGRGLRVGAGIAQRGFERALDRVALGRDRGDVSGLHLRYEVRTERHLNPLLSPLERRSTEPRLKARSTSATTTNPRERCGARAGGGAGLPRPSGAGATCQPRSSRGIGLLWCAPPVAISGASPGLTADRASERVGAVDKDAHNSAPDVFGRRADPLRSTPGPAECRSRKALARRRLKRGWLTLYSSLRGAHHGPAAQPVSTTPAVRGGCVVGSSHSLRGHFGRPANSE